MFTLFLTSLVLVQASHEGPAAFARVRNEHLTRENEMLRANVEELQREHQRAQHIMMESAQMLNLYHQAVHKLREHRTIFKMKNQNVFVIEM